MTLEKWRLQKKNGYRHNFVYSGTWIFFLFFFSTPLTTKSPKSFSKHRTLKISLCCHAFLSREEDTRDEAPGASWPGRLANLPFSSSKNSHFQNETKCKSFLVKMFFVWKSFSHQWLRNYPRFETEAWGT